MHYKKVGVGKFGEIVSLNKKIFDGMYPWPPYEEEKYHERLTNVQPIIFAAETDGKLVGNSIAFEQNNAWYIWILGVHEAYRRQGVADHLYELNEQHAKEIGCAKVTIKIYNVSRDMIRLALKRG